MPSTATAGAADRVGFAVVILVISDSSESPEVSTSSTSSAADLPVWPENDASFDYRSRSEAGASS